MLFEATPTNTAAAPVLIRRTLTQGHWEGFADAPAGLRCIRFIVLGECAFVGFTAKHAPTPIDLDLDEGITHRIGAMQAVSKVAP